MLIQAQQRGSVNVTSVCLSSFTHFLILLYLHTKWSSFEGTLDVVTGVFLSGAESGRICFSVALELVFCVLRRKCYVSEIFFKSDLVFYWLVIELIEANVMIN